MDQEKILDIAVKAGSMLLRNGAEIYRVEDTITRICRSYNLACDAFVLPTGVFVSVTGEKGPSTIVRRIQSRTVDLTRISMINALSRRIELEKPDYDQVMKDLDAISGASKYSSTVTALAYAVTAFVYVVIFGGNLTEALAAVMVGTVLGLLRILFTKGTSFPFIEYFVGGFVSGLLGSLLSPLLGINPYLVIIGALTNLVPGVALINGIRDLLHGDSVSGLSRLGEAIMTIFALAAGTGISLAVWSIGGRLA
jgi:uncharacterized membrane protein YjjP (DUF1212 family)